MLEQLLDIIKNPAINSLFHVLVVVPVLYLLSTDRFPNEYKKYFVYLGVIALVYHLYRFLSNVKMNNGIKIIEGMNGAMDCASPNVHCINVFDSSPGYSHPVIKVKAGDTIVWQNVGDIDHTITSTATPQSNHPDGRFNSGYMKAGDTFAIQITATGEYPYMCMVHKGFMRGMITVE